MQTHHRNNWWLKIKVWCINAFAVPKQSACVSSFKSEGEKNCREYLFLLQVVRVQSLFLYQFRAMRPSYSAFETVIEQLVCVNELSGKYCALWTGYNPRMWFKIDKQLYTIRLRSALTLPIWSMVFDQFLIRQKYLVIN